MSVNIVASMKRNDIHYIAGPKSDCSVSYY